MPAFQDLTGQRFNRLTVISRAENSRAGVTRWNCICDCGNESVVSACSLRNNHTKSCGCWNREVVKSDRPSRVKDLTDQRYGHWTVITKIENIKGKPTKWLCRCDCGTSKAVDSGSLRSGSTKSCGCIQSPGNFKHGLKDSLTYKSWSEAKSRCLNPSHSAYKDYGGRGITVCDRWLESFENFYEDMGDRPNNMTIDRINNNLGYSKENCRWATWEEQANNRRNNRLIELNGKTQNLTQWIKELGISTSTVRSRLRIGWSIEKALTTPINFRAKPQKPSEYQASNNLE